MSTSNESRRTLESDLFSSLFKSGGAESSSAKRYEMGEIKIASQNDPFDNPQIHQTLVDQGKMSMDCGDAGNVMVTQVDNDSTFTPPTMVVDAVYNAEQRLLGDSSSPKDNNGESEPLVMSATRKQWSNTQITRVICVELFRTCHRYC